MRFDVTLLGTNSALPAYGRFPTAQVLCVQERLFLIDCGEGTQVRLQDFQIKKSRINDIFISHLHGDHVFGLIGLVTSYNLTGRTQPLHIYSPNGLQEMLEVQLKYSGTILNFPLHFHVVDSTQHALIMENEILTVHSIPLQHRVPTNGFLFREKQRPPNIISEKIQQYNLQVEQIIDAKAGKDIVLSDGTVLPNEELVTAAAPPRSYAFCSDTLYLPTVIPPIVEGVDLLYHESTFCENSADRAEPTRHSTARQAASIARQANVGHLLLGHYSSRYRTVDQFEKEAREVFPNAHAGREGKVYSIGKEGLAIKQAVSNPE